MLKILVLLAVTRLCLTEGHRCYAKGDLEKHYRSFVGRMELERYPPYYMVRELERNPGNTHEDCPNYRVKRPMGDHSRRSISPWRYRIHVDENRFPKKLAYAECLCSGCIDPKDGTENLSMNSVPVEQTMMVLKRIDCPHRKLNERKYTYVVEYIKVPVACTCVIPKTHS